MPSPTFTVTLQSIASDGTNLYLEVSISDGTKTFPIIRPTFAVGTSAATITAYLQVIATNRPTLASDISALVGSSVTG